VSEVIENFRLYIQWLRGYAVLVVVLFHAHIEWVKGGYLGVDIFFVISGFLVTVMLLKKIEGGGFSFREFYFRRAKRLLPASYCTFLLSVIGAGWRSLKSVDK
jgi:peptidoglycan/LPS O-acetylase OafA/YrhL